MYFSGRRGGERRFGGILMTEDCRGVKPSTRNQSTIAFRRRLRSISTLHSIFLYFNQCRWEIWRRYTGYPLHPDMVWQMNEFDGIPFEHIFI